MWACYARCMQGVKKLEKIGEESIKNYMNQPGMEIVKMREEV